MARATAPPRLFYQQLLALSGQYEDHLDTVVFDRPPEAFRNVVLLERPNGDWGFTILRLVLYELADAVRLEVLSHSPLEPLPALARTRQREEKYHRMYGETWLDRLARATPDSHARVQAALDAVWPEALGLFEPTRGEADLLGAGLLAESSARQNQRWRERVVELCGGLDLRLPGGAAAVGGRRGEDAPRPRRAPGRDDRSAPAGAGGEVVEEMRATQTTETEIWRALETVEDPELPITVTDLGLIRDVTVEGGRVRGRGGPTFPAR